MKGKGIAKPTAITCRITSHASTDGLPLAVAHGHLPRPSAPGVASQVSRRLHLCQPVGVCKGRSHDAATPSDGGLTPGDQGPHIGSVGPSASQSRCRVEHESVSPCVAGTWAGTWAGRLYVIASLFALGDSRAGSPSRSVFSLRSVPDCVSEADAEMGSACRRSSGGATPGSTDVGGGDRLSSGTPGQALGVSRRQGSAALSAVMGFAGSSRVTCVFLPGGGTACDLQSWESAWRKCQARPSRKAAHLTRDLDFSLVKRELSTLPSHGRCQGMMTS